MRISDWSSDGALPISYYAYVKAIDLPQVAPYAGRIRMAGYLGFGLPLLAGALLLVLILKPSKKSLHGNARFANAGDLARHGDRKSVVSGKSVSVRVDLGGRRIVNKKKKTEKKATRR